MGRSTDRFPMAEFLLLALVASNSWHGAVAATIVRLHGHGAAGDKTSVVVPKHDISLACYTDESSSYLGLIGGLANLPGPGVPLGRNTMMHAAPVLSAYDVPADAKPVKRALAMGALVDLAHATVYANNTIGAVTSNGKLGDKARLLLVQRMMCSCKETIDDKLVLARKPAPLSEQPIGKGKASHLSLLHGSKQILTATSMYEGIQFGSVYGVAGSDQMIYEAVLTAFAAAIIACWTMNSTFVTGRSLSQKECVLLAVVLILSSITHVGCVDDDDDDEDPGIPIGPRSPGPIEGLRVFPVDFHMNDVGGGLLFLIDYELAMSDHTLPLDTGHYYTPLEVTQPLTWLTVGLPVPDMPVFATLLVRGDNGYNMGFLDGYGECFVTSDAITKEVLPFHGCEDLEFESNYRDLTNTPKPLDINAALEIEIGREVALEAAKVLAEYGRMPRTEANKEKARKAMRDLTVMVCEGINGIGNIMRNSWTTRTRLLPQVVILIFRWFILSTHKCLGNQVVAQEEDGDKLIDLQITTMADIDRELGMVKYVPACEGKRIPRPS